MFDIAGKTKEEKALLYAEEYGIIKYKVKGNRMIFYKNYKDCCGAKPYTVKCTVRLDTMKEERQVLKKYYGN